MNNIFSKIYNRLNIVSVRQYTHELPVTKIGNPNYGSFDIYTNTLHDKSIVYSIGIGEDVTFDLELIEKFGCNVYGFDATPRAIKYVEENVKDQNFHFSPYGISNFNGEEIWYMQDNPAYVSCSSNKDASYITTQKQIKVPVKTLQTMMSELGHDSIDLLKMDIEGSEYKVLRDILRAGIAIKQITLEFHHRFIPWGGYKTNRIIKHLNDKGYKLISHNQNYEECTFFKF